MEWPLVGMFHEAFAHRVFPHVLPLLGITLAVAEPMVKWMRLPAPIAVRVQLAELPFPIRHPLVKRIFQVVGCGEEMDVSGITM